MAVATERAIIFQEARDAIEGDGEQEELNIGDLLSSGEARWISDRRAMGRGQVKPLDPLPRGSVLQHGFSEYMLTEQKRRSITSTTPPEPIPEAA
jgi:hypothetical protein